jgi:hypothetical protein
MRFREWLAQDDWLDLPLLEGMLALHRLLVEVYGEPITLEPGRRDFELRYPGRHLDPILPAAPGGMPTHHPGTGPQFPDPAGCS